MSFVFNLEYILEAKSHAEQAKNSFNSYSAKSLCDGINILGLEGEVASYFSNFNMLSDINDIISFLDSSIETCIAYLIEFKDFSQLYILLNSDMISMSYLFDYIQYLESVNPDVNYWLNFWSLGKKEIASSLVKKLVDGQIDGELFSKFANKLGNVIIDLEGENYSFDYELVGTRAAPGCECNGMTFNEFLTKECGFTEDAYEKLNDFLCYFADEELYGTRESALWCADYLIGIGAMFDANIAYGGEGSNIGGFEYLDSFKCHGLVQWIFETSGLDFYGMTATSTEQCAIAAEYDEAGNIINVENHCFKAIEENKDKIQKADILIYKESPGHTMFVYSVTDDGITIVDTFKNGPEKHLVKWEDIKSYTVVPTEYMYDNTSTVYSDASSKSLYATSKSMRELAGNDGNLFRFEDNVALGDYTFDANQMTRDTKLATTLIESRQRLNKNPNIVYTNNNVQRMDNTEYYGDLNFEPPVIN